jgi:hypothetical protein
VLYVPGVHQRDQLPERGLHDNSEPGVRGVQYVLRERELEGGRVHDNWQPAV